MVNSIDYAFLRFTGVLPENQRRIQGFYVPFFAECKRVLDLGCGDGDFVGLLREQGIEALGIDRDETCCATARDRGLPVHCQDVFEYLRECEADSIDGIFSAHLVEHLPYEAVLELLRLSHRALRPGGLILLVTPNARSLYTHLESFYMHFGHVSFYHPELLRFLLHYVGFSNPQAGENPETATPLWGPFLLPGEVSPLSTCTGEPGAPIRYELLLPLPGDNWVRRCIRQVKMFAVHLIVQPYLDQIVPQINAQLAQLNGQLAQLNRLLRSLDRPVECYACATKPDTDE